MTRGILERFPMDEANVRATRQKSDDGPSH